GPRGAGRRRGSRWPRGGSSRSWGAPRGTWVTYPQCEKTARGLSRGWGLFFAPEFGEQPQAGELPPPGGRRRGDAEGVGRLGHRHPGEEPQLDQLRLARLGGREPGQGVVQVEQPVRRLGDPREFVEPDAPAAAAVPHGRL